MSCFSHCFHAAYSYLVYIFALRNNKFKAPFCSCGMQSEFLFFSDVLYEFAKEIIELLPPTARGLCLHWVAHYVVVECPFKNKEICSVMLGFVCKRRKMLDSKHTLTTQCLHFLGCHGSLLGGGPFLGVQKTPAGHPRQGPLFKITHCPQGSCALLAEQ